MRSEEVEVVVIELDMSVVADVRASFEMVNHGQDVELLVGFPSWTPSSPPAGFRMSSLSGFRVTVDGREYVAHEEQIPNDKGDSDAWYVWTMPYPGHQTVRVSVEYRQTLADWQVYADSRPQTVSPMYVLRTGALWYGEIEAATISFSAPSGGGFIGGPEIFIGSYAGGAPTMPPQTELLSKDVAAESSDSRIVWRLRNFEPDRDVGTTYVLANEWTKLRRAEQAFVTNENPQTVFGLAQIATELLGTRGVFGQPVALLNRLRPENVREHTAASVRSFPDRAETWEMLGNIEQWFAMPPRKHLGALDCWPVLALRAYRQADELGSSTARNKIEDNLYGSRDWHYRWGSDNEFTACLVPDAMRSLVPTPQEVAESMRVCVPITSVLRFDDDMWGDFSEVSFRTADAPSVTMKVLYPEHVPYAIEPEVITEEFSVHRTNSSNAGYVAHDQDANLRLQFQRLSYMAGAVGIDNADQARVNAYRERVAQCFQTVAVR